jgi:excisionase family DNA binding protein
LFSLSKIIEGNKTCENCILRELKLLKCLGVKEIDKKKEGDQRPVSALPKKKRPKKAAKPKDMKGSGAIQEQGADQSYTAESLAETLGKSKRRIQELAKQGKIPGRKVGSHWMFEKKEINAWISENTTLSPQRHDDAVTTSTQCGGTVGVNEGPPTGEYASAPDQDSRESPGLGEP